MNTKGEHKMTLEKLQEADQKANLSDLIRKPHPGLHKRTFQTSLNQSKTPLDVTITDSYMFDTMLKIKQGQ